MICIYKYIKKISCINKKHHYGLSVNMARYSYKHHNEDSKRLQWSSLPMCDPWSNSLKYGPLCLHCISWWCAHVSQLAGVLPLLLTRPGNKHQRSTLWKQVRLYFVILHKTDFVSIRKTLIMDMFKRRNIEY